MRIGTWIIHKHLQIQKEKQARKLTEVRSDLRRLQSRSPQLSEITRPELERVRQLSRRLKKVRSRGELKRWRAFYEMCLPAFEATINLAQPRTRTAKGRAKSSGRK